MGLAASGTRFAVPGGLAQVVGGSAGKAGRLAQSIGCCSVNPRDLVGEFGELIQDTLKPAREFGELTQEFGELAQAPPTWLRKSVSRPENSVTGLRK